MYKKGFYGGKFFPFHNGHKLCIEKALEQCEEVVVILFINGADEKEILKRDDIIYDKELLRPDVRARTVRDFCLKNERLRFAVFDCDLMHTFTSDGKEDWDSETDWVISMVGRDFEAVYSSEPGYDEYFKRAYPWATHIQVDPPRQIVPISATMIRGMNVDEGNKWI